MIVRLGLPLPSGQLMREARKLGAPLLLSAGAFARPIPRATRAQQALAAVLVLGADASRAPDLGHWLRFTHQLGAPQAGIFEQRDADEGWPDIALDSAGFVAWARHGGYPWTLGSYIELGCAWPWTWWSAPDACCEPEIAADADAVDFRVRWTAGALRATLRGLDELRREDAAHVAYWRARGLAAEPDAQLRDPMPILQGWRPEDYSRSALWTEAVLAEAGRPWPALVGVGSVCRRDLEGPAGLLAVLGLLDSVLPPHVRLHAFGVKNEALPELARFGTRIASTDSQAWDYRARRDAQDAGEPFSMAVRGAAMRRWWARQKKLLAGPQQADLFRRQVA